MTDDLITWLRDQLDDDEQVALKATPGPWRWVDPGGKVKSALVGPGYPHQTVVPAAGGDVYPSKYDAVHIALHDPGWVLADVGAKRRIVDSFAASTEPLTARTAEKAVVRMVLKLLALPYADRPGYREEWRP